MSKVCAFFGHSILVKCKVNLEKLKEYIKVFILNDFSSFLIGTHGEFDELCLSACLELKKEFPHIKIFKVYSNISSLLRDRNYNKNFEQISYNVEDLHFKQQITQTNRFMIDDANTIICYVDTNLTHSGALSAMNYALKTNKNILNIFKEFNN